MAASSSEHARAAGVGVDEPMPSGVLVVSGACGTNDRSTDVVDHWQVDAPEEPEAWRPRRDRVGIARREYRAGEAQMTRIGTDARRRRNVVASAGDVRDRRHTPPRLSENDATATCCYRRPCPAAIAPWLGQLPQAPIAPIVKAPVVTGARRQNATRGHPATTSDLERSIVSRRVWCRRCASTRGGLAVGGARQVLWAMAAAERSAADV